MRVKVGGTLKQVGTYAGEFNPSSGLPGSGSGRGGAILKGDFWKASATGTIADLEPFTVFQIGDLLYANKNNAQFAADFFGDRSGETASIQTVTSAATVTALSTNDYVNITAQAEALTIANPSGTPSNFDMIVYRIEDNGTARAITFGAQFRAIGVTLPTTTVLGKILYLVTVYHSTDVKWDVVSVIQQA